MARPSDRLVNLDDIAILELLRDADFRFAFHNEVEQLPLADAVIRLYTIGMHEWFTTQVLYSCFGDNTWQFRDVLVDTYGTGLRFDYVMCLPLRLYEKLGIDMERASPPLSSIFPTWPKHYILHLCMRLVGAALPSKAIRMARLFVPDMTRDECGERVFVTDVFRGGFETVVADVCAADDYDLKCIYAAKPAGNPATEHKFSADHIRLFVAARDKHRWSETKAAFIASVVC
jgi:hypothetical protein